MSETDTATTTTGELASTVLALVNLGPDTKVRIEISDLVRFEKGGKLDFHFTLKKSIVGLGEETIYRYNHYTSNGKTFVKPPSFPNRKFDSTKPASKENRAYQSSMFISAEMNIAITKMVDAVIEKTHPGYFSAAAPGALDL